MSNLDSHIQVWIDKADQDLATAKLIYLHIPSYLDIIAFHCQQAVEKYIKAVLVSFDLSFRRSHDLIYLLEVLAQNVVVSEELYEKASLLNSFSVEVRYPNQTIHLSREEIEYAISVSENFREFILQILSGDLA
jgi:HEPN domain-containing protein